MYEKPCECEYHIFGNNWDEYCETLIEMMNILEEKLKEEPEMPIRIYQNLEWDENNGVWLDGDCIFSLGEFPY